ncbi:hypothetical protein [Nocardioides sp. KR10-350]|uniref:hypothetical protein n=1 Tax=Nocardioides cheoyonin TaxID=3156615 RepID=UPI0032B5EDC7
MTATRTPAADRATAVANLVHWLETGEGAEATFAEDCFLDLSLPLWRLQADSRADLVAVRAESHPVPGSVRVERVDETDAGFVIAFEERWATGAQVWYSRELIRADVEQGLIVELAVACTGDWDEEVRARHAREVTLLRP